VKHDSGDEQALVKIQHDWAEARLAIVVGQGSIKAHTKTQDLSGQYMWTDTFVKMRGEWKAVASQVTPVLEK
jgi:hypothetical protein